MYFSERRSAGSGFFNDDDYKELNEMKLNAFLHKPYHAVLLSRTISEVLGENS